MKMLIRFSVFVSLALLTYGNLFAQSGVVRVEFPAELEKNPYEIVSLEGEGVLMFYAQNEMLREDNRAWHMILYDTNLLKVWETDIPVINGALFQKSCLVDSTLYLFFLNPGKIKSSVGNYQVSELEINSGIINHFSGLLPEVSEVKGFLVAGGKAILAADLMNEQAAVFFFDIRRQSLQAYITDLPDQNFVEDLQYDHYSASVLAVISNFISRKQHKLLLLNLDLNGSLMSSDPVEVVLPSKFLNSAKVYSAGPSERMIIGTYSNFSSKIPGNNEYYGLESAGFFTTRFKDHTQQFMNYYNFMELENLRSGISARDYLKLSRKKNRDEVEYSADYELLLHPLQKADGSYLLMAESFYPDFRTVSDISYDYWGRPITHTYTIFEGFRFYQSILMGFNEEGELLWDNSLDLANINTLDLSTRSGFVKAGKPYVLYYNDGDKISFRAYAGNAFIEGATHTELDTSYKGDKVVELGNNYMEPWYDGYFLCFGYHTIRNNLLAENEKRTVFYINKIVFE